MVFTAIRNEIAEFLTKPEWKESKNTQNILLVGCYILFDAKKTSVYILKLCRKIGQSLGESLRGGKLVKNLYFE